MKMPITVDGRTVIVDYAFNYTEKKMPHILIADECMMDNQPFIMRRGGSVADGAVVAPMTKTIFQVRNGLITHISRFETSAEFCVILGQQLLGYDSVEKMEMSLLIHMVQETLEQK
jgi:hypothetical protein